MKLKVQHHLTEVIEASKEEMVVLRKKLKIYSPVFNARNSDFPYTVVNIFDAKSKSFPTPYLNEVKAKLAKENISLEIKDERVYKAPYLRFSRNEEAVLPLLEHQKEAMDKVKNAETGIVASATGSGKTRLIEEITLLRKVKTLIIAPSISVRTGIYNELVKSFGRNNVGTKYPKIGEEEKLQKDYQPNSFRKISTMDPELIGKPSAEPEMTAFEKRMAKKNGTLNQPKPTGRIGGGMAEFMGVKKRPEDEYLQKKGWNTKKPWEKKNAPKKTSYKPKIYADITVVCFSALPNISVEFLKSIECVIVDECHHGSAATIRDALALMSSAGYRYGLSATPWRDKSDESKLLKVALGDNFLYDLQGKEAVERGIIAKPELHVVASPQPDEWLRDHTNWRMIVEKGIIGNRTRNNTILKLAVDLMGNNHNVFICVDEIAHMDILAQRLKDEHKIEAITIHGQQNKHKNQEMVQKVGATREGLITIGTMAVGEGTNMPGIDAVIIAAPGKSSVRFLQRIGRGTRKLEGKNSVKVYDFEDWFNPTLLKHSRKRQQVFKKYFGIE